MVAGYRLLVDRRSQPLFLIGLTVFWFQFPSLEPNGGSNECLSRNAESRTAQSRGKLSALLVPIPSQAGAIRKV